jgi:Fe-S-cluster containining protein
MAWNPCITCGACCAFFRASFYWAEGNDAKPDGVPVELTRQLTQFHRVMLGTEGPSPRCIALEGEIGAQTRCSIHPVRSSTCREFPASFEDGVHNERCDKARAAHGLPPLTLEDWRRHDHDDDPEDDPTTPPEPAPMPDAA